MGACGSTNENKNKQAKKEPPKNDLDESEKAMLKLKICRDNVKQYIKKLTEKEHFQREKAKGFLKENDRDKAKVCLNKSKMYKIQLESTSGQLIAIEEQLNMIESTKSQNQIFSALENGNQVLKKLQEEFNIERMDAIKDDMDQIRDKHSELNQFFQNHGEEVIENDEQLEREVEMLMKLEGKDINLEFPELKPKKIIEELKEDSIKEREMIAA